MLSLGNITDPNTGLPAVKRPQEDQFSDFNGEYIPVVSHDGTPVGPRDNRTTNDLFGLGLLDAITDQKLSTLADPDDSNGDGISGRIHWVTSHGVVHAGKFGRKSEVSHLDEFNFEAIFNEQGVANQEFNTDGIVITGGNPIVGYETMPLEGLDGRANPEVTEAEMDALNMYVKLLAPAMQNKNALPRRDRAHGRALFSQTGCADCHTPSMRTGPHEIKALRNKEIQPFSDFLLHDMGVGLEKGCKGNATPREWRTEPLWGLRFIHGRVVGYMHDGRAKSLEAAIAAHGSEGSEGAQSSAAFEALSEEDQTLLVNYLGTL
jgi:CxxC motif-containing protein (DUF1111 family)